MRTKLELWEDIARSQYPEFSLAQIYALSLLASREWYDKKDTGLAKLYEQYEILRLLSGAE
jgi:hypothetical protein